MTSDVLYFVYSYVVFVCFFNNFVAPS